MDDHLCANHPTSLSLVNDVICLHPPTYVKEAICILVMLSVCLSVCDSTGLDGHWLSFYVSDRHTTDKLTPITTMPANLQDYFNRTRRGKDVCGGGVPLPRIGGPGVLPAGLFWNFRHNLVQFGDKWQSSSFPPLWTKHLHNAGFMDFILVWDQLDTEWLFFSSWFANDAQLLLYYWQ